jgi:hypothetical protein
MSSRRRGDRALKAVEEGKAAFLAGKPITTNPFKVPTYGSHPTGAWSLYGFWNIGYNEAKNNAHFHSPSTH